MRFNNKIVIVTGAAQGIGQGVALAIAKEGGTVIAVDRSDLVKEVVAEATKQQLTMLAFQADLEKYQGALAVAEFVIQKFNRIDILINNVGGTIWAKPYEFYEEYQIAAEIQRSLFPTLWCCRVVLPQMVKQQQGVIVNVSSVATRSINRVPYAAAKGGVNALTASLAFEYARQGIRVNAIAPGGTDAPPRKVPRNEEESSAQDRMWYQAIVEQTKNSSLMHRYGVIAEQVAPILFIASDDASYITGTTLPVAGGDQG